MLQLSCGDAACICPVSKLVPGFAASKCTRQKIRSQTLGAVAPVVAISASTPRKRLELFIASIKKVSSAWKDGEQAAGPSLAVGIQQLAGCSAARHCRGASTCTDRRGAIHRGGKRGLLALLQVRDVVPEVPTLTACSVAKLQCIH